MSPIVELITRVNPNTVLDVGTGFGKYGVLAREHLERVHGDAVNQWRRRIDGIEAFAEYLSPIHEYVYDNVYLGDALELVPKLETTYDLALLIDVIEHFSEEDGWRLLRELRQRARNLVITTPLFMTAQGEEFGNPYERHRFQWQPQYFRGFGIVLPHPDTLLVLAGEDAERVAREFHRQNVRSQLRRLRRMRIIYRSAKRRLGIRLR